MTDTGTLESKIEDILNRLVAQLEPLKTSKVLELIKITTKGEADMRRGAALEWRGYEVIEESPSEDEFEAVFWLTISLNEEDPDRQRKYMLHVQSKVIEELYKDRTLSNTVVDVKILSGEAVNVAPENVREEELGFGTSLGRQVITVRFLIHSPT